ncbi:MULTISPECIES: CorA family divalent cation transporter [Rhodococcus]|uniref:CorA family divalent cation transporter n=1 Tax=Rhodococcus TaxID=1827 RepID=UPI001CF824FC|nr:MULTISPECIES: CorA family divalent cation transporter [Rhodococcus]
MPTTAPPRPGRRAAAPAAVPTTIAGIYGTNVDHMPELHREHTYHAVPVFIVVIVLVLIVTFRRDTWL